MDEFYVSNELQHITEVAKNKLFFGVTYSEKTTNIKNSPDNYYFTIDDELQYLNYYLDFGPLNISCLFKYCNKMNAYLNCSNIKRIIHYTSSDTAKRVNGAYLIGSFAIIYLKMDPKCVYRRLLDSGGPFRHFVDASQGISRYTLKLIEALSGIQKAHLLNFFDFTDFNAAEYDLYDKIQNGDFNWLVPRKFLAFIGPIDKEISANGHSPNFYIKYFLKNDIKTVIRLNNKLYDPNIFTKNGIEHFDLFFPDGTTPPKQILCKFLNIAEKSGNAIAVHCKAGLGRTGSLIGAYIMKHYHFTAKEAIAWMRICRPGSVIGQQQGWLEKIEPWLWKQGSIYRLEHYGDGDKLPFHKFGLYSKIWPIERNKYLVLAHKRAQSENRSLSMHKRNSSPNAQQFDLYKTRQKELKTKVKENDNYQTSSHMLSSDEFLIDDENRLKKMRTRAQNACVGEKTQGDRLNEIKMKKYYKEMNASKSTNSNTAVERMQPRDLYKRFPSGPMESVAKKTNKPKEYSEYPADKRPVRTYDTHGYYTRSAESRNRQA